MSLQNHFAGKLCLSFVFVCIVIFISAGVLQAAYPGDLNTDGTVDWNDLDVIAQQWLDAGCGDPNQWCAGADIDKNTNVDLTDYALLAQDWLQTEEIVPPIADWFKGSIHYHTTNSDGSGTVETMVLSYRDSGGQSFSCITDHDYTSDANQYTTGSFLGINGVEASAGGPHVVGLGMNSLGTFTPGGGLQGHIDNIIAGGGLPMVAHPRWSQAEQGYDMPTLLNAMTNCKLIAVFNWYCEDGYNGLGNSESYWDTLLTNGKMIYGYAEDDAHGTGRVGKTFNRVGTNLLTLSAIKNAFESGNTYFGYNYTRWADGIKITDYSVTDANAGGVISIATTAGETIKFIGNGGSTLKTVSGSSGDYTITGSEKYVRIKVTNATGDITWTQPVFVEGSPPPPVGYQGYEPLATGGQGGTVVHVTNTNDSGAGSLRDVIAALTGQPTTIVFDVAGVICPASEIRITKSNVTIDGSSAPSPGITVAGAPGTMFGIDVDGDANIIIKHMRFRNAGLEDLQLWDGNKITVDHCSFSGSGDGALDINQGSNLLVSRCLFGGCVEVHKAHGTYVSVHHNLYTRNNRRQPRVFGGGPYWDFRNNVVEYWTNSGTNILQSEAVNIVNNWYGDPDPNATCATGFWSINDANYVYTNGNYSNCGQNIDAFGNTPTPNTEPNVTTLPASQVPANVLADVGAQPTDAIDQYYINGGGINPPAVAACGGSSSSGGGGGGSATYLSPDIKDGYVVESSETSGVGGASNQNSSYLGDSATNQQYITILHFDTSAIPDGATVTAATLTIRRFDTAGTPTGLGSITVDIKNGYYGTDDVLRANDFEAASSATNVATIPYPASDGDYSSGTLNATGRAQINKTGITQFKIRFITDDDNDATADYLYLYDSSDPPSLAVTWE